MPVAAPPDHEIQRRTVHCAAGGCGRVHGGGQKATRAAIDYYRANAAVIAAALDEAGIWYCGGKNSPYIWMQCPGGMKSWDFFDHLLEHAGVVGTPGAGFGAQGEGYFRLTGFGDAEKTRLAAQKLKEAVRVL